MWLDTWRIDDQQHFGDNRIQLVGEAFLDVVDYHADNWLRCWFLGFDSSAIAISQVKSPEEWQLLMGQVLQDLKRILKPGGYIAFEVGEVRGGDILLEELVLPTGVRAGLTPVIILINVQEFTKTANTWGVANQRKGTNTNRIVVLVVRTEFKDIRVS